MKTSSSKIGTGTESVMLSLYWSTYDIFLLSGTRDRLGDIFELSQLGRLLVVSSGYRSGCC